MKKLSIYTMNYKLNELHRKVRDLFPVESLSFEVDSRGYVKKYNLTDSQTVEFMGRWKQNTNTHGVSERAAILAIEQALNIKLIRQFKVCQFFVDAYHKESNTVYEIDGHEHFVNGRLKAKCVKRQKYIENQIGCTFVRIKV